jgi:2'-5' RNA ligase
MTRTSLVVLVPEVDQRVQAIFATNDSISGCVTNSHVTILHPFRSIDPSVGLLPDDCEAVASVCATIPGFTATFAHTGRFPGQVLFLKPEPENTFRTLTRQFAAAFPNCPPYAGKITNPIPHLTIAQGLSTARADMINDELLRMLSFSVVVAEITLMVEQPDRYWRADQSWPLRTLNSLVLPSGRLRPDVPLKGV